MNTILSALFFFNLLAHPVRVAIVDTGLDLKDPRFSGLLCRDAEHIDLTGEGIEDKIDHGTAVAGVIKQYAGDKGYCFIIIKYLNYNLSVEQNFANLAAGITLASSQKADFINISSYGYEFSMDEYLEIKRHPEITYIVAVGNDGLDIGEPSTNAYPANYHLPNIIAVGALAMDGVNRASFSNYREGLRWEVGEGVISTVSDFSCKDKYDYIPYSCIGTVDGTSFAAPIVTGKLVKERLSNIK